MRYALADAGKNRRRVVSAFINRVCQDDAEAARTQCARSPTRCVPNCQARSLSQRGRDRHAGLYNVFNAAAHQDALDNRDRDFNGEIKRRTEAIGIFPKEDAIVLLINAVLLKQNDE